MLWIKRLKIDIILHYTCTFLDFSLLYVWLVWWLTSQVFYLGYTLAHFSLKEKEINLVG